MVPNIQATPILGKVDKLISFKQIVSLCMPVQLSWPVEHLGYS